MLLLGQPSICLGEVEDGAGSGSNLSNVRDLSCPYVRVRCGTNPAQRLLVVPIFKVVIVSLPHHRIFRIFRMARRRTPRVVVARSM